MLLVWTGVLLIYNLHDKVENCLLAMCAKCRGDGEFEYDSEDDESEDEEAANNACEKCEIAAKKKIERR